MRSVGNEAGVVIDQKLIKKFGSIVRRSIGYFACYANSTRVSQGSKRPLPWTNRRKPFFLERFDERRGISLRQLASSIINRDCPRYKITKHKLHP
jgi:hypothetical protein